MTSRFIPGRLKTQEWKTRDGALKMQQHIVKLFAIHSFSSPAISTPAFSTPALWCRVFHSRVFHPCSMVPRFPLPRFPLPRIQRPFYFLQLVTTVVLGLLAVILCFWLGDCNISDSSSGSQPTVLSQEHRSLQFVLSVNNVLIR